MIIYNIIFEKEFYSEDTLDILDIYIYLYMISLNQV